uniref:Uncharacterized protein n=1 Tax=Pithovirus LCPAC102 TaxID=2506587 RepID=A0A481Z330_9VIRU|nr:MAG: hypothetical protein LCPAC102_01150 [Pithovirus LCPAC102]
MSNKNQKHNDTIQINFGNNKLYIPINILIENSDYFKKLIVIQKKKVINIQMKVKITKYLIFWQWNIGYIELEKISHILRTKNNINISVCNEKYIINI